MAKRRWLEGVFRETFRRHGYREVQTPTFEHTALFEAKSGPNVVDEIYGFKDKGGRDVCLRPELTAPVMRYYLSDLTHEPKPLKLFYYGPCFRYEEPQEGRYREFWQFGLELLGPEGPAADAEVVAVAARAIQDAGLTEFALHVGHIGVLRQLMGAFEAPASVKAALYRKIDKDDPSLDDELLKASAPPPLANAIAAIVRHRRVVATPAEDAAYFARARELAEAARGNLVDKGAAVDAALAGLEETAALLRAWGVARFELDLGVARGLDYYTGMVFELEAPRLGAQKQIGGGGAYALAEVFGGEHVGSVGFGLGFDRILLALEKEGKVPAPSPAADVYVAVLGQGARAAAHGLARELRDAGRAVDVDVMGRALSKSLQHAAKVGARVVVIVGEKDLAEGRVTLRDMVSGAQETVPREGAAAAVLAKLP